MARVWWEGFDERPTNAMLAALYTDAAISAFDAGRTGGYSARFGTGNNRILKPVTAQDRYSIGFAFKTAGYGALATSPSICQFGTGTLTVSGMTNHVTLGCGLNGEPIIYTPGGTQAWVGDPLTILLDVWHWITIGCIISDTIGKVFLSIDNVQKVELTGIDTQNGATGTISGIALSRNNSASLSNRNYDDWYIDDTYDKALPERTVETLFPVSDGGTLNLTPSTGTSHFSVVDESPYATTDYLTGSTAGQIDLLGLTDLSITPSAIDGVRAQGLMDKTDAVARTSAVGLKSGAVSTDGTAAGLSTTSLVYGGALLLSNPATSTAWNKASVDALQAYPKVVS